MKEVCRVLLACLVVLGAAGTSTAENAITGASLTTKPGGTVDVLAIVTAGGVPANPPATDLAALETSLANRILASAVRDPLSITFAGDTTGSSVLVYGVNKSKALSLCRVEAIVGNTVTIDPARNECDLSDDLGGNAVHVIKTPTGFGIVVVKARNAPIAGSDYGFALTIADHWGDDQKFQEINGVAGYYALSKLKNGWIRPIAQVSFVDDDPDQEFETALGVGVLLRTRAASPNVGSGLAMAIGVGNNLMLKDEQHPWYTFLALAYNLSPGPKQ